MTTEQLLTLARKQIHAAVTVLKRRAAARKNAETEIRKELELFLDDCYANGLSWDNPSDRLTIIQAWKLRLASMSDDDEQDWDRSPEIEP